MRLRFGPIPENQEFEPMTEGYLKLKEPSPNKFLLLAGILSIFVLFIFEIILYFIDIDFSLYHFNDIIYFLIAFIAIVPLHEFIHAVVFPGFPKSDRITIGFWKEKTLFYAFYDGDMSVKSFKLSLAMPFIVLTIIFFVLAWITKNRLITFMLLANAVGSSGDLLSLYIIRKLPNNAIVKNKGWQTYWKCENRNNKT